MEDKLSAANKRLKTAHEKREYEYEAEIKKLDEKETNLTERLNELNRKKLKTAQAHGDVDATDEDLIEVNAGGKTIAAKRSTFTQLKGTRLEALFCGRWDKKLQRDKNGHLFLDVNPACFQAVVDYLNEMMISSEDNPADPPSVDDNEDKHLLEHYCELFELNKVRDMPDSNILKNEDHVTQLHKWLKESESDGEFRLLYRSSRDGSGGEKFHSKCDNAGCTLTVVLTSDGFLVGGYSNTSWRSKNNKYENAKKAFLFCLAGNGSSRSFKMKLTNTNPGYAIYNHRHNGPTFGAGQDLCVSGSSVSSYLGNSYEHDASWPLRSGHSHVIKEMEVFQVIPGVTPARKKPVMKQVENFSKDMNDAINNKWTSLQEAEEELASLEESFKDEGAFISFFSSRQKQGVVTLNVCGTIMMTRLETLQLCKESVLASKFSNEGGKQTPVKSIKEWNHEDVVAWLNKLEGISESVVKDFEDNEVTGLELVSLGVEGLKDFGVTRKGTIHRLLYEIKKLETAGSNSVALIEHSPYCFEKILDHLRMERSFMKGLVKTKHGLPVLRESERGRYQKIMKHLFPGESSKIFENA